MEDRDCSHQAATSGQALPPSEPVSSSVFVRLAKILFLTDFSRPLLKRACVLRFTTAQHPAVVYLSALLAYIWVGTSSGSGSLCVCDARTVDHVAELVRGPELRRLLTARLVPSAVKPPLWLTFAPGVLPACLSSYCRLTSNSTSVNLGLPVPCFIPRLALFWGSPQV